MCFSNVAEGGLGQERALSSQPATFRPMAQVLLTFLVKEWEQDKVLSQTPRENRLRWKVFYKTIFFKRQTKYEINELCSSHCTKMK